MENQLETKLDNIRITMAENFGVTKTNNLSHYPLTCDFNIEKIEHSMSPEFNGRNQEFVQHAATHEWNVVNDLIVVLKKI